MILFEKYGQHCRSTGRASAVRSRALSSACRRSPTKSAKRRPAAAALRSHPDPGVRRRAGARRRHAGAVLAKGKTRQGRVWTYVRDDLPFAGPDPPAAVFFYSPDRRGEHPEHHLAGFAGILQANAYGGFNRLYEPDREPGPALEAACWAHAQVQVLRARRDRPEPTSQAHGRRPAGGRGGQADRWDLRSGAPDQRRCRRGPLRAAPSHDRAAGRRP